VIRTFTFPETRAPLQYHIDAEPVGQLCVIYGRHINSRRIYPVVGAKRCFPDFGQPLPTAVGFDHFFEKPFTGFQFIAGIDLFRRLRWSARGHNGLRAEYHSAAQEPRKRKAQDPGAATGMKKFARHIPSFR